MGVAMDQQDFQLIFPADFGSEVLSSDKAGTVIAASKAEVRPVAAAPDSLAAHHDFGATTIAVLGTAAGVAAVEGLFGLFKTLIEEAYETKRAREAQDHEVRMLLLTTANKRLTIDLDAPLEATLSQVDNFAQSAVGQ